MRKAFLINSQQKEYKGTAFGKENANSPYEDQFDNEIKEWRSDSFNN